MTVLMAARQFFFCCWCVGGYVCECVCVHGVWGRESGWVGVCGVYVHVCSTIAKTLINL